MSEYLADSRKVFSALDGEDPITLFSALKTPCYIIDEVQLRKNGEILCKVAENTGCKILLAQKAFSNYNFYPLLAEYLSGTEASGLFEARLGYEEMPDKEVHVFCGAYREDEFDELLQYADHIVFNSPHQLKKFGFSAKEKGKSIGLRINPEFSTQDGHGIYDPCAYGSRLGTTRCQWDTEMTSELVALLDGLHFHTLCEQNADDLVRTVTAVENRFGDILPKMKWLNMGGGHHITRWDYAISLLERCITDVQKKWNVQVYLEPGEAVALNAGYLATRVLDIVQSGDICNAILDVSASCHMPDVIEMPYTPPLYGAMAEKSAHCYRLTCPTCLAGDVISDYYFGKDLHIGDMLLFGDMAIYSTCKNNTFNGMPLPNIFRLNENRMCRQITDFDYYDFKMRLGSKKYSSSAR